MFGLDNPFYKLPEKDQITACEFVWKMREMFDPITYQVFVKFFTHLCNVQNPSNREFPMPDSIIHGVEVAKICLMKSPNISITLIFAALGINWDRACGEKRVKAADYGHTEEGYLIYKETHARASADMFCAELSKFFDRELVDNVHAMIVNHEVGGEGDMAILDFADGLAFFIPANLKYYRFHRQYKGEDGQELSPLMLAYERQVGFARKIGFMLYSMSLEDEGLVKAFIIKNQKEINPEIKTELNRQLSLDL